MLTATGLELPDIPDRPAISRDPDDDIFIALAIDARAEYLVTRDGDLKGADEVRNYLAGFGVAVLSVRQFMSILEPVDL